jgi:hypothetical protein
MPSGAVKPSRIMFLVYGLKRCVRSGGRGKKQQVPPLRCAPVGMTILFRCQNLDLTINLSSRPKRTRISCHAALEDAACAPFRREKRMEFAEATNPNRKSGGAKWRDLLFFSEIVVLTHPLKPVPFTADKR